MEKQQTVLIVEDEKNIVDILRFNLQKEGYATLEAFDGVTGLRLALDENPDLILLDLMLPEMNGFEVCKLLRDKGRSTPVLIITAREEEAPSEKYTVVGTACESTDVFDENVTLRRTHRGDLLTIKSAGAYGMSMASRYNLHDLPGAVYSDEL